MGPLAVLETFDTFDKPYASHRNKIVRLARALILFYDVRDEPEVMADKRFARFHIAVFHFKVLLALLVGR